MNKQWFQLVNFSFVCLALALFALAGILYIKSPSRFDIPEIVPKEYTLPKGSFTLSEEEYDAIGPPFLDLNFSPLSLQLPDLKRYLVFYGKNERPDATEENTFLHFGWVGDQEVASTKPGDPLYLKYKQNESRNPYQFSPENEKTSLWISATANGTQATVYVAMQDDQGRLIKEPKSNAEIKLQAKDRVLRRGATPWQIGKFKVDGTLLARQRARWWGQDLFLEQHGGEEYEELANKQRIDFTEEEAPYSVYVGLNDALIWDGERWRNVKPGKDSIGFPLLLVKSIEDRLMKMELWDVEGKTKIPINLLRSTETWIPKSLQKSFKFVGARTRSQYVFEIDGNRTILQPYDWLLLVDGEWFKLQSAEDIDRYVERQLVGPLFVFEGMTRKDGQQYFVATLFNSTRTDAQSVEFPVAQGPSNFSRVKERTERPAKAEKQQTEDEGEEEEFDEE